MTRYIDKDALVAEIERRVNAYQKNFDKADNKIARLSTDGRIAGLKSLLDFLGTIEVKEADLKKEFSQWWKSERAKDYNVDILYERYPNVSMKLAKHFFELGLKAQKNISINVTNIALERFKAQKRE